MTRTSRIVGLGRCVPDTVLTNEDLAKIVDTNDEWIRTRTGIRERRVVAPDQAASDLAIAAGREALDAAGVRASDIDLILVGSASPDHIFPATACLVQDRLGAANAGAVDISAACSSFVYALSVGHAHIVAGLARRVLVIGAEALSRVTDFTDRSTCVLFGDGAGAVVLAPSDGDRGFLSFWLGADGSKGSHIALPAGGSRLPASAQTVADRQHYIKMAGQEVYKFATRIIPRAIEEAARRAGLPLSDVELFIPHQANIRIIEAAAERLGQPMEKFFVNVDRYGNTSAASVPVALYEAVEGNRVRDGDHVVLLAFGGGLTWASCALRWG